MLRKHLHRDCAIEPRVARTPDLSHAARTDAGDDLIRAKPFPRRHAHEAMIRFTSSSCRIVWTIKNSSRASAPPQLHSGGTRRLLSWKWLVAHTGFEPVLPP